MKYPLFLFVLLISFIFSCKETPPKDYVTFSGKITNHLGKDGEIFSRNGDYSKVLKINADGSFSDTLHIPEDGVKLMFSDGNEMTELFLKKGDDISLTLNTDEFDETIKYEGKGASNNNYLAAKMLLSESLMSEDLFNLDEAEFKTSLEEISQKQTAFLAEAKGLDPALIKSEKKSIEKSKTENLKYYKDNQAFNTDMKEMVGKPSPTFTDFENYKGGTTSLSDLKGKYVYIDAWATWCGPCKAEIPHLKTLEEQFRNKNIAFVSISTDKKEDYDTWRNMISEKQMTGIQLIANDSWRKGFAKAYQIRFIPRFILLDPKGNVIDANMSRPSEPKTAEFLTKLLK